MKIQLWTGAMALLIGGCVDAGTDPQDLGTAESVSEISVAGGATWSGTSPITLGQLDQETCWLTGIGGQFLGQPYQSQIPSGGNLDSIKARIRVYPNHNTGMWQMDTDAGQGSGVNARAICVNIPYTSNKIHELAWQDNIVTEGHTGNLNTQCFLRDIWATSGLQEGGESFREPHIELTRRVSGSQSLWDLDQSYVHNWEGSADFGGATAVCVDFPAGGRWNFTFPGAQVSYLRDSYPSGPRVPVANVGCGLTGIRGEWSGGGLGYGGFLDNDPADTQYWKVAVDADRTIDVSCVE